MPVINEVVGDDGFDGDRRRSAGIKRNVSPSFPLRANRDSNEWAWDPGGYTERDRVERRFRKAKPFRQVATRSEELKVTDLGLLHRILGFIRIRSRGT